MRNSKLDSRAVCSVFFVANLLSPCNICLLGRHSLTPTKSSQLTPKCDFFGFPLLSGAVAPQSPTFCAEASTFNLCNVPMPTKNTEHFNSSRHRSSGMEHRNRLNVALHSHFPTSDYFRLKFLENGSTDLEAKHSVYTPTGVLSNGIVRSRSRRLL